MSVFICMDARLLIDIANIGRDSKGVQRINPVEYATRANPRKRAIGLLGQELSKVEPLLVSNSYDIDYKSLATVLLAVVKDLEERVSILEQNQTINNLNQKKVAKNAKV